MSREVQFAAASSEIHVIFHQAAQSSSRSLSAVSISMKFQCDESETVVILINIIFRSVSRDDRIRLHCCQKSQGSDAEIIVEASLEKLSTSKLENSDQTLLEAFLKNR